ncbi:pentapeptide repeat-containing protein [Geodermatophilus sp. TF02-6]|uniref:pentapeptide repeat-containing protein n=1 Tax=Geodermatophilus sp. TF02-6 TaxID=2250575 RepID=UPI000DEB259E|nr:pentapeptide repeat-containing protein [Geodermatophilus sp. TF02-6]RBY82930.1 pentapeptide repeat-containing protein [Geodermatophilus sp. TF02-6]
MAQRRGGAVPAAADPRAHLRADCARCAGLCCVAPAFAASADFAIDKPAGRACPHLQPDSRCGIHAELRERGFPGCTVFDCFGAGQQTVQVTFGGRDWRESPELADRVFAAFGVQRQLHELLWYLTEALALPAAAPLHRELTAARERTVRLTAAGADELAAVDPAALRAEAGALLAEVSERARATVRRRPPAGARRGPGLGRPRPEARRGPVPGPTLSSRRVGRTGSFPGEEDGALQQRGADLVGADLRRADLRGVSLRGAYLIGADLRDADLRAADLLGADLRAADLRGADLSGALFLTRPQVAAARGDAATRLPAGLEHPVHWERR